MIKVLVTGILLILVMRGMHLHTGHQIARP